VLKRNKIMSSFSTLEIGKRALQAANFALDVTSNNIANATTEGYSRREMRTSEGLPFNKFGYKLGTGVNIESLRSFRQQYLDREVRKANAYYNANEANVQFYNSIETIFQEPTDSNIGEMLNKFLYYFDEISLQPESIGLRQNLLSITHTLCERLNNTANELVEMRKQANTDLINQTDEANKLIQTIAECNKAIAISKDPSGQDCLTFIDKREVAIEKLSELGNVSVSYEDNGIANVFINGIDVVTGPTIQTLKVIEDVNDLTGESTLRVVSYNKSNDLTIDVNPPSGKMGAALNQYNIMLDPVSSVDNFSIMQTLDRFANTIATKINAIFETGFGLNDTGAVAPNRWLFDSTTGGTITAGNIKVSDSVNDAADIPLSANPNTPGDSQIAQQVSRLLQDGTFLDGQRPIEFYSNFIGRISQNANEAVSLRNSSKLVVESLNSTRDSVMGVNMDEEAINIIKFQKNLEAASKIIATNNQVLATIINLGS
jgi:flagellar hook-associated protein 1 FlgK